jgi:hypothetical protein
LKKKISGLAISGLEKKLAMPTSVNYNVFASGLESRPLPRGNQLESD